MGASDAEASARLLMVAQALAARDVLVAELAAARTHLEQAEQAMRDVRRRDALEQEDAKALRRLSWELVEALVTFGLSARRSKEEREAMQSRLRLQEMHDRSDAAKATVARLEERLAAMQGLEAMRSDWVEAKRKASGVIDERAAEAHRQSLLYAELVSHFDAAFDVSARCRGLLRDLLGADARGPWAGKVDAVEGGLLGLAATHYKHEALDRYEALAMLLRQELRELDATPVVHCPELEHYVTLNTLGDGMALLDYGSEFMGALGPIVDARIAWDTRKPSGRLRELDGRLAGLQSQLEARKAEAMKHAATWRATYEASISAAP